MKRLVAGAALLAAGCVSVLPEAGPPPQIYRLQAGSQGAMSVASAQDAQVREEMTVLVTEPLASRALSTDRVAVATEGDRLSYAAGARWSERAPRVVQERVLSAFEADPRVAAAVRPEDSVPTRYELRLELLRFEAVYRDGAESPPTVVVEMRAKLITRADRALVAATRFDVERRASANRLDAIIAAFDEAMAQVGGRLVDWTLEADAGAPAAAGPQSADSAASSSR